MAHPAHARSRSRQLLFLACTLPLLATATACGSGSEEPTGKSPETTSSAPPTTSSSASPTTSTSHATPKPTLARDTDQADEGTPEPATSPHNVAPQPDRSNGAATTPGTSAASTPDYNCRNRSAPPLNKCPSCGATYTGDQVFCEKCGAPLHTDEPRTAFPGMKW